MDTVLTREEPSCYLKADFLPFTVIYLQSADVEKIRIQLQQTIHKAPNYFNKTGVILDLSKIDRTLEPFNLTAIISTVRQLGLLPAALRGLLSMEEPLASTLQLPLLNTSAIPRDLSQANKLKEERRTKTLLITKPIRSGTQVYAKGGDLVIVAAVHHGAECLADGHIHVYGALRGRALAGIGGDVNARIFCHSLEAELVSIAGYYKVEEGAGRNVKGPLQIYLKDRKIQIESMV